MEPLHLLGGKYQEANQILSGTLQTFRAVDAASRREVFVHRVASSDPIAQQLALLLSSALIRSAKARRLVLDVAEADGFAYVVTETEHQCLLLREWLQLEINQATGQPASNTDGPARASAARKSDAPTDPAVGPNAASIPAKPPADKAPEPAQQPGEFTRMFMASTPSPSAAPEPRRSLEDTEPSLPVIDTHPPPEKEEPAKKEPGEFTRMFMAATAAEQKELRSAPSIPEAKPDAPKPSAPDPGEFTRFFQAAKSPEPKAAPPPEAPRSRERPSDFGRTAVQRPSTPLPSLPSSSPAPAPSPKATEPGEFTRLFNQGGFPPAPAVPSASPFPESSLKASDDLFANPAPGNMFQEQPPAVPAPGSKPLGEYTRLFGPGGDAPPVQQQSAVAPPPRPVTDDPLLRQPNPPAAPAPSSAPVRGPSEYTLVMSGRTAQAPSDAAQAPAGGAAGTPAAPMPQVQVNVAPPPDPMQGLHVPPPPSANARMGGMSASGQMGPASASVSGPKMPAPPPMNFQVPAPKLPTPQIAAPQQNKNKLILLFVILGVLAILLVILIVLILKK